MPYPGEDAPYPGELAAALGVLGGKAGVAGIECPPATGIHAGVPGIDIDGVPGSFGVNGTLPGIGVCGARSPPSTGVKLGVPGRTPVWLCVGDLATPLAAA